MSDDRPPPKAALAGAEPIDPAQLESVLEGISDAFYALDTEWRYVVFNRAAEEYFGISRTELLGRPMWEVFPQGRGTDFERYCQAAMHEGRTATFETPSRLRPDRVVELRITPMRGGGVAVALSDVTERRRAQDALAHALARSEEILESISDAFYAVDGEWRFTYVNRVAEAWWGRRREDLIGKVFWDEFPVAVGSSAHDLHLKAAQERTVQRLEAVSPILGRWVDVSIFPSAGGLSVYFRDISERKAADDRQRLLVNELNHRVKNALATVQAIAAQSLSGEGVEADARERFTARLMALARANDVLVAEEWRGATLQAIADQVASPYAGPGGDPRFTVSGPPIHLTPGAATAVALALHELATNAAKYGALSSPDGQVALSWSLAGQGDARTFHLTWAETGGPPVQQPARTGFGSRLIQRGLSGALRAQVRLDYRREGLVCDVSAPLSAVGEGG